MTNIEINGTSWTHNGKLYVRTEARGIVVIWDGSKEEIYTKNPKTGFETFLGYHDAVCIHPWMHLAIDTNRARRAFLGV